MNYLLLRGLKIRMKNKRESEMIKFLGIDIGSTGIKGVVVDEEGEILQTYNYPLTIDYPKSGYAEQHPDDWWEGVKAVLKEVSSNYIISHISFSGQMHTLVTLDDNNKIIRPAIMWCDQRTHKECIEATEKLGGEHEVLKRVGNPFLEGFTLPKILWLKANEPENYKKINKIMLPKDYIVFKLTGNIGTDYSDASGTACLNIVSNQWDYELLDKLEINKQIFPKIYDSTAIRGSLIPELSEELGWDNTYIVSGGADNAVAALGLGISNASDCMVSIGTSGTVLVVTDNKNPDETGKLHYFIHVLNDKKYYMGVMLSATNSLNFIKNNFFKDITWQEFEAKASLSPAGANGLIFLPYLNGERTPHRDAFARGVIYGLSSKHNENDIVRCALEGVAFGLRDSFELNKNKGAINKIKIVGGGAKNLLLCRILATNFKSKVELPLIDEGAAYGAAMLAAMGSGMNKEDVLSWYKTNKYIEPTDKLSGFYSEYYEVYKSLYHNLKETYKDSYSILERYSNILIS
jgi:xylulokinase